MMNLLDTYPTSDVFEDFYGESGREAHILARVCDDAPGNAWEEPVIAIDTSEWVPFQDEQHTEVVLSIAQAMLFGRQLLELAQAADELYFGKGV